MLHKIEEDERKVAELRHKQCLNHQEKLKIKKEQEVRKMALQAAFEKMRKTKRWEPPPGLDVDIDIRDLEMRAEEMVLRGKHAASNASANRTNNNSFSSATATTTATPASRGNNVLFGTDRQTSSTQIPTSSSNLTRERPHTAPQQRRGPTDLAMPMLYDRDSISNVGSGNMMMNEYSHSSNVGNGGGRGGENSDHKRHGSGSHVIPAAARQHEHDEYAHSSSTAAKHSNNSARALTTAEEQYENDDVTYAYSHSPGQKSGNPHSGYMNMPGVQPAPPASRSANQRPASAHVRGRLANSHNVGANVQVNGSSSGNYAGGVTASVQSNNNDNNNNNNNNNYSSSSSKMVPKKPADGFSNSSNRYNAGQRMLVGDSDTDNHEKTAAYVHKLQQHQQQPAFNTHSHRQSAPKTGPNNGRSRSRSASSDRRASTASSHSNRRASATHRDATHDQNAYEDYMYNHAPVYDARHISAYTAKNVIHDDVRGGPSSRAHAYVDAWKDAPQPANALQNAVIKPSGKSRKCMCVCVCVCIHVECICGCLEGCRSLQMRCKTL
jgi:hypothetical protein